MVIKTRYGGSMTAHVDYIQRHGKIETFGPSNEEQFKKFVDRLNRQMKTQGRTDLMMRKFIISPDPKLDLTDEQLKEVTEAIMNDLQENHGEFKWFGVIHRDTNTPHVHVVSFGSKQSLTMKKSDINSMRERLSRIDYRMYGMSIETTTRSEWYKYSGIYHAVKSGSYEAQKSIFEGKFSRAKVRVEQKRKQRKKKKSLIRRRKHGS